MDHIRRTKRQRAGWIARYSTAPDVWHPCRVVDISRVGAGLILDGPLLSEGQSFTVGLQIGDGTLDGVNVPAIVRNVSSRPGEPSRVGVAFEGLNVVEEATLVLLVEREKVLT